jgi:hypothetical protein
MLGSSGGVLCACALVGASFVKHEHHGKCCYGQLSYDLTDPGQLAASAVVYVQRLS